MPNRFIITRAHRIIDYVVRIVRPTRTRRGRATYACSPERVDEEIQSYEQFKHRKEAERES